VCFLNGFPRVIDDFDGADVRGMRHEAGAGGGYSGVLGLILTSISWKVFLLTQVQGCFTL